MAMATALLVAVLGLGAFGVRGGFAQESTPSADDATITETADAAETTRREAAAAAYDEFVAGLAANLSITDATSVDAAIRATFTDMVAAKLADGEISADAAASLTERIEAGEMPLGIGLGWLDGGPGRMGGIGGSDGPGDGRGHRGGPMGDGDDDDPSGTGSETDDADAVGGGDTERLEPAGTPVAVI